MKTTSFLASLLFGSFAAAAPVDKRALVYATEMVTETVVVFTTVWDDSSVPSATNTPAGYFYEQPQSTAVAQPTPSPLVPVVPVQQPSSTPAAPSSSPAPAPAPSSAPAQQAQPSSAYVAPVAQAAPTSAPAAAPVAATSAAAPAPAATSAASSSNSGGSSSGSGDTYQNVDITIYDINEGDFGACGTALHSSDMIVAIAQSAWGQSTYDRMTGAATNPWCGQKIKIDYNGNSIDATIMDLCPGCSGFDIDLSMGAWKALTGKDEKTRLKASWSKI